jgi:hypothetical protein
MMNLLQKTPGRGPLTKEESINGPDGVSTPLETVRKPRDTDLQHRFDAYLQPF